MKKKLLIIPSILFLFILSTFFYLLIIERNPFELPSNLLNKNVPNFETESLLKNENFVSSKEFGNEIILVNFFATWCGPCRDEHFYIKRFSNEKRIRVWLDWNIDLFSRIDISRYGFKRDTSKEYRELDEVDDVW